MDRYTSMGISNDAREFLDASQLTRREKPVTFTPTYFLVCQSLELSFKAFLRGTGYSDKRLRGLSHNLDGCVAAAKAAGLESQVSLSAGDIAAIAAINPYYQLKDFQYSVSRYKSFPHPDVLITLGEHLWKSLRPFCEQQRTFHFGKPTAIA
jgi:hypothetical protein